MYRQLFLILLFAGILLGCSATPTSDSNPSSNTISTTTSQTETDPTQTIAQVIAILGVYAATMFVMAIGTEIVVDVVKLAIGLKDKPTARETLEKYKTLLPGTLESLGASAKAQQEMQERIAALETVLRPVEKTQEFLLNLQEGEIGKAVQMILADLKINPPSEAEAKSWLTERVEQGLFHVGAQLELSAGIIQMLTTKAKETIATITGKDVQATLVEMLNVLQGDLSLLITDWVRRQIQGLNAATYHLLQDRYHTLLRPQLLGFGLEAKDLRAIDSWFAQLLQTLEKDGAVGREVEIYLASMGELLQGLENQRNLLRSPLYGFWDRLCHLFLIGPIFQWLGNGISRGWQKLAPAAPAAITPLSSSLTATNVARTILEQQTQHEAEGRFRVKMLRLTAVIIGVVLAWLLKVDSADLLHNLISPQLEGNLATPLWTNGLSAGIILSGLAASAGSSFWHDQLGRLRAAKETTEEVARVIQEFKAR